MAGSKLHRSQMTGFERAQAREASAAPAGVSNRQGGMSYFTQGRGDAPTQTEMESGVQWARGVEQTPHTVVRFGPDFSKLLPDVPVNTEAAGPSPLRVM